MTLKVVLSESDCPRDRPSNAYPARVFIAEAGGYGGQNCRINITQKIPHDGEVNRARYMPQNSNIIASKTIFGTIYIFDKTKHPSTPTSNACKPDIKLVGQDKEGYGLSWSPLKQGHILSASEDATVCCWYEHFKLHDLNISCLYAIF